MNISEYIIDDFGTTLYRGTMSIKEKHMIANANEALYKYVGVNSARPITAIIHPDDLPEFYDSLEKMKEETQHLFMRFWCFDKEYKMMYVIMNYNGRFFGEFPSYDMELIELGSAHERLIHNVQLVKKYRTIMSFSDKYYFDYEYETGLFTIFNYKYGRYDNKLHKKPLAELKEEVHSNEKFTKKQIAQFDIFCECLEKRLDEIEIELDGDLVGLPGSILKMRGGNIMYDNEVAILVGVITLLDKDGREKTEDFYLSSAAIDRSTGVFNKRAIEEIARAALADNGGCPVYFSILDIDEFKHFNDTYGHLVGDKIITHLAKIMKDVIGNRGVIGRFGGDEFVIVGKAVDSDEDFINILKTIRKNMQWQFVNIVPETQVTVSIGIVKAPNDGTIYEELFEKADKCLYLAKQKGKNRYVRYSDSVQKYILGEEGGIYNIKTRVSDNKYKICQIMYDIIDTISHKHLSDYSGIVNDIKNYFDIDFVEFYNILTYKPVIRDASQVGKPVRFSKEIFEEVSPALDEYGVFAENKILSIKESMPHLFAYMENIESMGFMFVKNSNTLALFSVTTKLRKWSDSDKGFLSVYARAMSESLEYQKE